MHKPHNAAVKASKRAHIIVKREEEEQVGMALASEGDSTLSCASDPTPSAVVAAAATCLPEVVGDAGLLVATDDVDAWAAEIIGVLEDDERRVNRGGAAAKGRYALDRVLDFIAEEEALKERQEKARLEAEALRR